MIEIKNLNDSAPYIQFINYYEAALEKNQLAVDAICISSFSKEKNEVESRFVNLKYINNNEWTFFSNYNSNKAKNFISHNQISALIYWNSIDVQIRMKAHVNFSNSNLSDNHFKNRSSKKNSLAISSYQSKKIESYEEVIKNFEKSFEQYCDETERPSFWGGYDFIPYYFEFWKGNENRINERNVYELNNNDWEHYILQP